MRLVRMKLRNFRCYKHETILDLGDLTAIIGRNDAGKSSLMDALAIFFGEIALDKDDASVDSDKRVEIACVFDDVPDYAVLDEEYPTTFADEFLLNGDGRLEIVKQYNGGIGTPKLTGVFARAVHPTAENYNDLLRLIQKDLRARAKDLGVDLDGVNKAANAPMRAAIRDHAPNLEFTESLISLDAADAKQIWGSLAGYLPVFALFKSDRASTDQDVEAQDPLKSAIKEALKTKEADLAIIQEHVTTQVQKIADETVKKIAEMDPSLAGTLSPVITAKKWEGLFQTSITGDEGIPLNKRGSGVRRLILLNFFRAKAEQSAKDKNAGSVIYAVEEPETSQHPRNQRMLMAALSNLAAFPTNQVIITTHTPMLARALPDDALRFVRHGENGGREILRGGGETNNLIAASLGVLPDHSVKLFIGVEGKHDIAFFKGISKILISEGEEIPDLEALEIDGKIIFFPLGGGNLALWAARLAPLNRPEFHLYDRDNPPPAIPQYQEHVDEVNDRDRCCAILTTKREMENYIHHTAIEEAYRANGVVCRLPGAFADFDDAPEVVAKAIHAGSGSPTRWEDLKDDARKGKASRAKAMLNNAAIRLMTRDRLRETDPNGDVISWLRKIDEMVNWDD